MFYIAWNKNPILYNIAYLSITLIFFAINKIESVIFIKTQARSSTDNCDDAILFL